MEFCGLDRQNPEVMFFPLKTDKFVLLCPFITEDYGTYKPLTNVVYLARDAGGRLLTDLILCQNRSIQIVNLCQIHGLAPLNL